MEGNRISSTEAGNPEVSEKPQINPAIILWGFVSLAFAILACVVNTSAMVLSAGFFAKLIAVIVGAALGLGGALIGDALRKFAHPDAVYTTGGFFLLIWIKVFWKIGPQVIGMGIGVVLGMSLVLK